MNGNPYQAGVKESGVPAEVESLIIKRARKVWLIPLVLLASFAIVGRIPLLANTPQIVFTLIGFGILIIQVRGLLQLNKLRAYWGQIPQIKPHLIAGLIICGYPLILMIVLFSLALIPSKGP